jgi:hypothetical protein
VVVIPPQWSVMRQRDPNDELRDRLWHLEDARGLPMRAFAAYQILEYDFEARLYEREVDSGIRLEGTHLVGVLPRALPYSMIWPGFAIDTLFYAAIWLTLFFGIVGGKRAIRRKRGRCPRCGYDLRGQRHQGTEPRRHEGLGAGCPECGWNREESAV